MVDIVAQREPASSNSMRRIRAPATMDGVFTTQDLLAAVDAAFARRDPSLAPWPPPHPDRSPRDDEYSRLTNPQKWRILGARADAWILTLTEYGLATAHRADPLLWESEPGPVISTADVLVPRAAGALPLTIARSRLGDVDDAGVTLGVRDPAVCVAWFPDCGCDACDSGSRSALDDLDAHLLAVVTGGFRRLSDGDREITVRGDAGWSASGRFERGEVAAVLAEPSGWREIRGRSWLSA